MDDYRYGHVFDYKKGKNWTPLFLIAALSLGVVSALLLLPTVLDNRTPTSTPTSLISRIEEDPNDYLGSTVTVQAPIENMVERRTFVLENPGVGGGEILVVSKQPLEAVGGSGDVALYQEKDTVQVSGIVRKLNIQEVERELGFQLNEDELREWEGKPVIVANTVESRPDN